MRGRFLFWFLAFFLAGQARPGRGEDALPVLSDVGRQQVQGNLTRLRGTISLVQRELEASRTQKESLEEALEKFLQMEARQLEVRKACDRYREETVVRLRRAEGLAGDSQATNRRPAALEELKRQATTGMQHVQALLDRAAKNLSVLSDEKTTWKAVRDQWARRHDRMRSQLQELVKEKQKWEALLE